jgi:glycosyltransferase involved in cell wall biosynthesis
MFTATLSSVDYTNPWTATFDERLRTLRAGSPRIAYYYTQPDTSTFRYRVFNMIEALRIAEPSAGATWFTAGDGDRALEAVGHADVVVVCRSLYAPHVASFIERARALGKRVLYDVDDLIFDTRYTHLIMETLDQVIDEHALQAWFGWISRWGTTLQLCEGVITTNPFLAARIHEFHDVPTWIVPNFLNDAQLAVSKRLLAAKEASGWARDRRIHVGYFSGTPTHNRDFAIAEPALLRLMHEDPRIVLRVVGFLPSYNRLRAYGDRIEELPLLDFLNLQRVIGEVEINIVPLQLNVFTNSKSELKYFEAAVVGTITAASPAHTLTRAIRDGQSGLLAHVQDWDCALKNAIAAVEAGNQMAAAAAADALERYSPEAQGPALRRALLDEAPTPPAMLAGTGRRREHEAAVPPVAGPERVG